MKNDVKLKSADMAKQHTAASKTADQKSLKYRIIIKGTDNLNPFDELIKVFLRPDEYILLSEAASEDAYGADRNGSECRDIKTFIFEQQEDKDVTRQEIFDRLSCETGLAPKWGIMTGIRPVKLFGMLTRENMITALSAAGNGSGKPDISLIKEESIDSVKRTFREHYRVSAEKSDLTEELYRYQTELFGEADDDSCGIYIGIPFCPTRCLYCSFASNPADEQKIKKYLEALHQEIDFCGELLKKRGWYAESIYVGGGTPTTLTAEQLDELLEHAVRVLVSKGAKNRELKEFTVEAGRPDTITSDKIKAMLRHGAGRISINPQSMKADTLKAIGRDHTPDDVREAFRIVRSSEKEFFSDLCGDTDNNRIIINTDIIAGLPGEDVSDIEDTLREIIELGADNITVHSLAVKRASRLAAQDRDYHYRQGRIVAEMLDEARKMLGKADYRPYYLYRQKHMSGAQENTGYCLEGTAGIYNVRIMDEHQRIIAMGAGGISKAYDPLTRSLSRVPNVTNEEIYVERIGEMIERKRNNF